MRKLMRPTLLLLLLFTVWQGYQYFTAKHPADESQPKTKPVAELQQQEAGDPSKETGDLEPAEETLAASDDVSEDLETPSIDKLTSIGVRYDVGIGRDEMSRDAQELLNGTGPAAGRPITDGDVQRRVLQDRGTNLDHHNSYKVTVTQLEMRMTWDLSSHDATDKSKVDLNGGLRYVVR